MASLKYCDKHNQVGFLKKPKESAGFAEIVDFLKGSHIRYALTHNPTVHNSLVKQFCQTATASTLADGTLELSATIDTLEYTVTEVSVRSKLQLANASGISMLPNTKIFEGIGNMGYPTDGQADQAGTQFQPSSSTVPPPPTSQPAPTESTTIPPTPTEPTSVPSSPSTAPEHEPMEHPFEQPSPEHQPSFPRQESDIPQTQAPTHTHEAETGHMSVDDLFQLVPQLMTRIDSLEKDLKQTKQTMGNAIVKLVKKVKKMEKVVKSRRVVLTDSEDEAAKNSSKQGRNLQKDESKVFKTPKQGKSSGETVRRRLDTEDVNTGFEDVSTGFKDVSTGEDVSKADYAQRMVGLISQRRKLIAEQKAKAQRDKPMTQAQQRQYMATYLKNQGAWKLAQIKKLIGEELKEKFEYLMRSMERFMPMDTEKESRKRTGVELQTESSKKLKSNTREDVSVPKEKDKESVKKEEEFEIKKPILRYTKRKSLARKGLQKNPESAKSWHGGGIVESLHEERVDEPL
ncbi:hypothetical protein Tco_1196239 [Tanacetum coccineum]